MGVSTAPARVHDTNKTVAAIKCIFSRLARKVNCRLRNFHVDQVCSMPARPEIDHPVNQRAEVLNELAFLVSQARQAIMCHLLAHFRFSLLYRSSRTHNIIDL